MKVKRESKTQVVREPEPDIPPVVEETPEPERLPAVYYGDRDGGDVVPQPYRQTTEMREAYGGQRGTERGEDRQESSRQSRIDAEAKERTEKLNRTGYLP